MTKMKKDVVLFFIAKVVVGIVGLLLVSLYSANLSTSAYGEYSLIAGLISALISIFIGWIGSAALRYYIDYENDKKKFFCNILLYIFIMLVVIFGILTIISFISVTIPLKKYLFSAFFYTFSYSMIEVFEKIYRASQKTVGYTIGMMIQAVSSIIIFYILTKVFYMESNAIFYSNSFSRLIFLGMAFVSLSVIKYIGFCKLDKKMLKKFLKYGIPMIGVWGVSWILSYCDRYIIAMFYDTSNVAIYDMSYKLAENTINIIITAFTLAIFPTLIRVWKDEGKKAVETKITDVLHYYLLITIPAIIGLSLVSKNLYYGIIDSKYLSGQNIIIIVSIGMGFNGLNSILNKVWQLNEKTKNIFYIMVVSVIINIILNVVLIPKFGIVVASITTLVSYLISTVITYYFANKEFKILFNLIGLGKTLVCTIVMSIFILWFNNYVDSIVLLGIEIILAIIIYGLFSIIIRNIDVKEMVKSKNEKCN